MIARMSYYQIKEVLKEQSYPLALVDLDAIDKNFEILSKLAKENHKRIRISTKSFRVPFLIKYLYNKDRSLFSGIKCYRVSEASYLFSEYGFEDILIGYPEVSKTELSEFADLAKRGCNISMVTDSQEHLELINSIGEKEKVKLNVVLELDGTLKILKDKINIGSKYSSISSIEEFKNRLEIIKKSPYLNLKGVMLHEAPMNEHPTSLGFIASKNPIRNRIKNMTLPRIQELREKAFDLLIKEGFEAEIVNGGNSISFDVTVKDETLSEVNIGSAFLGADYVKEKLNLTSALFFAIEVVRKPSHDYITCMGGGYISSGSNKNNQPKIVMPLGLNVTESGFGDIQTLFKIQDPKLRISLGDPVLLTHANSGELAEHFSYYLVCRDREVISEETTYRGEGLIFL